MWTLKGHEVGVNDQVVILTGKRQGKALLINGEALFLFFWIFLGKKRIIVFIPKIRN
jgi:hypothetical protein